MRSIVAFIMRGRMPAVLLTASTAILSLIPLLAWGNYISAAIVGLVTLRKGWDEGLKIILGAGGVLALFAWWAMQTPGEALVFIMAMWLPVWLLALILRITVSWSWVFIGAASLGAVLIGLIYLAVGDPEMMWRQHFNEVFTLIEAQQPDAAGIEAARRMIEATLPRMTGLVVAALTLGMIMGLVLARVMQASLYNPGGFRQEFYHWRMDRNFALATLAVGVMAMVAPGMLAEMADDILLSIIVIYILNGLSLVHSLHKAKNLHVGWLVAFYVLIIFLQPAKILLALVAYADSWLDFRKRWGAAV